MIIACVASVSVGFSALEIVDARVFFSLAPFPVHLKFGNQLSRAENATETLAKQARVIIMVEEM